MNNQAYPLLTHDFVEYLTHPDRNTNDKVLLEIGSGDSTIFWASYFKEVFSYEHDSNWITELNSKYEIPGNVYLQHYEPNTIFNDDEFINRIQASNYIVIDNNPRVIPRGVFSKFVAENMKADTQIVLDNGTWNMDAYVYLIQNFFCLDFPGTNKNNELTVTSLFISRKLSKYFEYTIEAEEEQ
jgi:hypothetical protein